MTQSTELDVVDRARLLQAEQEVQDVRSKLRETNRKLYRVRDSLARIETILEDLPKLATRAYESGTTLTQMAIEARHTRKDLDDLADDLHDAEERIHKLDIAVQSTTRTSTDLKAIWIIILSTGLTVITQTLMKLIGNLTGS